MPYLAAIATAGPGDEYTVYIMHVPGWKTPVPVIPWWYAEGGGEDGGDGFRTSVSCTLEDGELDAALTAWAEANGWTAVGAWAHTEFGVRAHVRRKPGNGYQPPAVGDFHQRVCRQAQEFPYSDNVFEAIPELMQHGYTLKLTPPRSQDNRDKGFVFMWIFRHPGDYVTSRSHGTGLQAAWEMAREELRQGNWLRNGRRVQEHDRRDLKEEQWKSG